jgi:hypothetical protein
MNELRKAAVQLLALLIVVVAGDRLASLVLSQPLTRSEFRFARIFRGGVNADVVVIGDSRGVTSIDVAQVERLTGRRAFTFAYNGMPLTVSEALLAEYLQRNRPPRLVMLEVTSAVESPGLLADLHAYAALSPRLTALYAAAHPTSARVGSLLTLLRFNSEIYLRTLYYLRRPDQDWTNHRAMSEDEAVRMRSAPPWILRARSENLVALERMIRMLEARHVEVRLFVGPYLPEYRLPDLDRFVALIAGRTHLPVWNYARAVTGASNFADVFHLNDKGAAQLAGRMAGDGFFAPAATPRSAAAAPRSPR